MALGAVIVEGMRAIQKRQEQHLDPAATREDSGGVQVRVQPDDVKQRLNPSGGTVRVRVQSRTLCRLRLEGLRRERSYYPNI